MSEPDSVEAILARMMPPALSMEHQGEIEAMLDELAGPAGVTLPGRPWLMRLALVAAVVTAAVIGFSKVTSPGSSGAIVHVDHPAGSDGVVLVSESDRIEAMTDEGWQEDSDGSAMQAMRLSMVEENQLLDEETGIVMEVSEPREEIWLMPVSSF